MGTRILLFAAIFIAVVAGAYFLLRPADTLPIYHPAQLDPRLVDPALKGVKGEHQILDFSLVDQNGDSMRLADVGPRIIVADFFFTTCPTICPKMTVQMARAYAQLHGADPQRWRLLTGDRKQIYALARKSYFAALDEGDGGPDDFVHTENFVLVDPQRRLRGFYDGTSATDVDRLIGDIHKLLEEGAED
jgi:protein SCO1/2